MIWLFVQVVILINYLLELSEGYIDGFLLKDAEGDKKKELEKKKNAIVYINRALQVLTEAPLLSI